MRIFLTTILTISFLTMPLMAVPFRIGFGFGYNGDYFNQSYIAPLAVGTNGAFEQELNKRDAKEEKAKKATGGAVGNDLTFEEGGCPDTAIVQEEPIPVTTTNGDTTNISKQIIRVRGLNCRVSSANGSGISLSALETEFVAEFDLYSRVFLRTGMSLSLVVPVRHTLGVQYSGQFSGVGVSPALPPAVNEIGAAVEVNSKATVSYSGYHLQLPVAIAVNLYETPETSMYFGAGLMFSNAAFVRRVTAQQNFVATLTGSESGRFKLDSKYYRGVTNRDELSFTVGILYLAGARWTIKKDTAAYIEFRWLTSGSADIKTKGTKQEEGKNYANETLAALVIEGAFPGSVAQALQSDANRSGGRTANGLNLSYEMRLNFGIIYNLEY